VIRTLDGIPFAWPEHLERLRTSAHGIAMALDLADRQIMARVQETVAAARNEESYVRIVVTRGTGLAPNIDLSQAPGPPRWVILVRPLPPAPAQPAHLAIVARRRNDARALDPAVKSGNYLNNVLGLAEARSQGATDCLFLNTEGHVTEASTANLFAVRGGEVLTPPLTAGILAGITRALLLEYCKGQRVRCSERDLTADELRACDELFLSSTLREVLPVTALDGKPFRDGQPGPVTRRLQAGFREHARQLAAGRYRPALERLLR
jgi:branched-chain amino acid aminotransferase